MILKSFFIVLIFPIVGSAGFLLPVDAQKAVRDTTLAGGVFICAGFSAGRAQAWEDELRPLWRRVLVALAARKLPGPGIAPHPIWQAD